jgi:hypothetical protein
MTWKLRHIWRNTLTETFKTHKTGTVPGKPGRKRYIIIHETGTRWLVLHSAALYFFFRSILPCNNSCMHQLFPVVCNMREQVGRKAIRHVLMVRTDRRNYCHHLISTTLRTSRTQTMICQSHCAYTRIKSGRLDAWMVSGSCAANERTHDANGTAPPMHCHFPMFPYFLNGRIRDGNHGRFSSARQNKTWRVNATFVKHCNIRDASYNNIIPIIISNFLIIVIIIIIIIMFRFNFWWGEHRGKCVQTSFYFNFAFPRTLL